MPVRKRPWVFVCFCGVCVCCEDILCEIDMVVPNENALEQTYCKCCMFQCVCLCLCEAHVYACKKETMGG